MPQGGSFPGRTTDGERLRERIISYLGNLPNVFSKRMNHACSVIVVRNKARIYDSLRCLFLNMFNFVKNC